MFTEKTKAFGLPEFAFISKSSSDLPNPGKPRCEVILVFRAIQRQTCWQDLVSGQALGPQMPASTLPTSTLLTLQNTLSVTSLPRVKATKIHCGNRSNSSDKRTRWGGEKTAVSHSTLSHHKGPCPVSWDTVTASGNKGSSQGHRLGDRAASYTLLCLVLEGRTLPYS